mgnify:CR=1 FL=1
MQIDFTKGSVAGAMLRFSLPLIAGNLLQQCYNITDTLIVSKLGADALAAVGTSYAVMVFLTSVILGLCMGSGILFSMLFGAKKLDELKTSVFLSFVLISILTAFITLLSILCLPQMLSFLDIPQKIRPMTQAYLFFIFLGLPATFFYNFFASLLRAIGNSLMPLIFLGVCAVLNIFLDWLFVFPMQMGVSGAAIATIIAQFVSAIGMTVYCIKKAPHLIPHRRHCRFDRALFARIINFSLLTCVQQSVMNFGILLVQGVVNRFGVSVMAAFAAAVKIDSFAYMPVQDFGNAFSTFIAQNKGAGEGSRIKQGIRTGFLISFLFCIVISTAVILFAAPLMTIFIDPSETQIIQTGITYLYVEGSFYFAIGFLFLFYGLYRGLGKPGISVVLTVVSLGLRVLLAYVLSPIPQIGVLGIWWAIPIGWVIADLIGVLFLKRYLKLFSQ